MNLELERSLFDDIEHSATSRALTRGGEQHTNRAGGLTTATDDLAKVASTHAKFDNGGWMSIDFSHGHGDGVVDEGFGEVLNQSNVRACDGHFLKPDAGGSGSNRRVAFEETCQFFRELCSYTLPVGQSWAIDRKTVGFGFRARIVGANIFEVATVTCSARICDHNAIYRSFFCANSRETNLDHEE
jgi:hypothetical protein